MIPKKECMDKCKELADIYRDTLVYKCHQMLISGSVDLDEFENDYRLPKLLATAAARNSTDIFSPPDGLESFIKNLEHFA